ncbi:MAG: YcfL family protein [Verrucomicrobiota bacterium]|nr:YcfL family protein [Verrucomicrobiota bacterium]
MKNNFCCRLSDGIGGLNVINHVKLLSMALLAAGLLAGCHTGSVNTVERAEPVARRQLIVDKRISHDPFLKQKLGIVAVNQATTPAGLLQIQVEILNRTSSYMRFNYQFEWFDANGMRVSTPASTWVTTQLEGGESKFLTGVAPTPACQDFRLKLIKSIN